MDNKGRFIPIQNFLFTSEEDLLKSITEYREHNPANPLTSFRPFSVHKKIHTSPFVIPEDPPLKRCSTARTIIPSIVSTRQRYTHLRMMPDNTHRTISSKKGFSAKFKRVLGQNGLKAKAYDSRKKVLKLDLTNLYKPE